MKRLWGAGLFDLATILGLSSATFSAIDATLWVGLILGFLAVLAASLAWIKRHRDTRGQKSSLTKLRDGMMLDRVLEAAARSLELGGPSGSWRMSLYELDLKQSSWALQARASSNELFADHSDFPIVAHDKGVLRSCFDGSERPDGRFDEMPPLEAPEVDSWLATMKAWWGVTKTSSGQLKMKSRSFTGAVFKVGPQNGHQITLGIVAESEAPDGTNIRVLRGALTRPFFEAIAELLALRRAFDDASASEQGRTSS